MPAQTRTIRPLTISVPSNRSDHAAPAQTHPTRKSIRAVQDIDDFYAIGGEVMPSFHRYMEVKYGIRKSDGEEVVIKLRHKPHCFKSSDDEMDWRRNTEFLLNMPECCGVAKLYDVIETGSAFYVVMEKVKGMDLFEALEAHGGIEVDRAREIVRQLLVSLAHLHQHNAVHKDLKLENVMMSDSPDSPDSVKVIDFDTLEEWTPSSPKSRDVVGTDQYISQEAYAGRYSPVSDIFSAGVIAYRLLSGKFPFQDELFDDEVGDNWVGSPKMENIRKRLKGANIDFSHSVFRLSLEARDLVSSMLAYDALDRPTAETALEHPWFQINDPCQAVDNVNDCGFVAKEAILGDIRLQTLFRA